MSDGQKLLLILILLYGFDCLVWIGRRTVLFSSAWTNRRRAGFAADFFGNSSGSVAIVNPLPFLAPNYLAHWPPVSISPEGVCSLAVEAFPGGDAGGAAETLGFEEIAKSGTDGKRLLLNGARFAMCGSEEEARAIAGLVRRLGSAPKHERENIIRAELAAQFNRTRAVRRLRLITPRANALRRAGTALFAFLYVAAPVASCFYGVANLVIPAGIAMFLAAWSIGACYYRADRALHPARVSDRIANLVNMCICAPAAIRAADFLTLRSMNRFHPVLLADLLLGGDGLAFAQIVVRNLKYPGRRDIGDPVAAAIVRWQRDLQLEACAEFVEKRHQLPVEELLVQPEWDGGSAAYCPRCLAQYPAAGKCMDCPGTELIPFKTAEEPEAIHES